MNDVREDVTTAVAQTLTTAVAQSLLAFPIALVAYRADVDVWEDVVTSVAQAQDALVAFQMALVVSWVEVDHLNDVLNLQKTDGIGSSRRHGRNLAIRILRHLFFAYLPSSYH